MISCAIDMAKLFLTFYIYHTFSPKNQGQRTYRLSWWFSKLYLDFLNPPCTLESCNYCGEGRGGKEQQHDRDNHAAVSEERFFLTSLGVAMALWSV